MKLLTHNMLSSKLIKGVREGYPLQVKVRGLCGLESWHYSSAEVLVPFSRPLSPELSLFIERPSFQAENLEDKPSEFNKDFIVRLIPKIRYEALYAAAKDVRN